MIKKKIFSLVLLSFLVLGMFQFLSFPSDTIPSVKAEVPALSSFGTQQKTSSYTITQGQNNDYYYLSINQSVVSYDGSISHEVEYVGFSKNTRGDICFTSDGSYVGKIIPVAVGKFGGNWWLVPLRNVDNVTSLGSREGYNELGDYTEIYYNGYGNFVAYQYNNYGVTQNTDLIINEVSIRCYHGTGECKINVDVTLSSVPQDSGFGFLFYPDNPQQFRYVKWEKNNVKYDIDLLTIGKLNNPSQVLEFWSQAGQKLGITWKWDDLYSLGSGTHFEVLNIQGTYGLLTGSYGYGSKNRIVVDPTLTVSDSGTELSVVNTWNSGTSGYNFTVLQSIMAIDRLYDYGVGDWVWDGNQADSNSRGWYQQLEIPDSTFYSSSASTSNWVIQEESDTRIKLKVWSNTITSNVTYTWFITCYAGLPVFYIETDIQWLNVNDVLLDNLYFYVCDKTQDNSYTPTRDADTTDDVLTTYAAYGGYSVGKVGAGNQAFNMTYMDTTGDSAYFLHGTDFTMSQNEWFNSTVWLGVHSLTTSASIAWGDELDDEISDAFPAITSVTGLTYGGRNNSTGAFDFTHTTGNDASFVFTDIDTEQNMTAFHIDAWNLSTYTVWIDNVLKTEDTDYYAAYNATTLDLDIVYPELSTATIKIASAHSSWSNFLKLTIDSDDVDEVLTDFPALVKLSTSSGINSYDASAVFDEVGADSEAIGFYASDNSTRLYFEVEDWNATSEVAWVWVKIPSVSNTSNTVFWLGYDSTLDGSNWHSPTDVWDSNYVMVQHMNDATTSTILDSTGYDNDGTKKAANEPIEATGKIGQAQDFDSGDDYISSTASSGISSDYTISLWVKRDSVPPVSETILMQTVTAASYPFILQIQTNGKLVCYLRDPDLRTIYSLTDICDNVFHHVVFVRKTADGVTSGKFYIDAGTPDTGNGGVGDASSAEPVYIGSRSDLTEFANVTIDELQICSDDWSSAWVGASYETQRDHFLVLGSASPVNTDAQVTNLDDTDNIYAQLREYLVTYNGTHADGYASFTTVDLTLQTGTPTERLTIRYTEVTDIFTELSGDTTKWELVAGSSSSTKSGTNLNLTVALKAQWNSTEEAGIDIKAVATDDADRTDTDTYDLNYDVVTNLVVSGFACDDDRGNVAQTITFTGTVYYANNPSSSTATTFYPPDAEFTSVSIYDDWNNNEGSDSSIVNGAFSVAFTANATVGIETYNPYINMVDADYTDAEESPTDTYIADGLKLVSIQSPTFLDNGDFSYLVQTQYAYNNTGINAGVVRVVHINGTELTAGFTANATGWAIVVIGQTNSSSAGTYTIIGHTEPTFGITDMYQNQTFLLDSWTLQARDAAGANLPRSVVFDVTDGTDNFDAWTSSTAGLSDTIYAPNATAYTVTTTWGTHTVDSDTVTLTGNTASTLDTKIQRLSASTNYILMSLDNTDMVTPTLSGEANILLHSVVATGSLEFKADHANWKVLTEPDRFDAGTSQYNRGDGTWAWASSIFSLTSTYSGTQDLLLYFTYSPPSGGGGGGGGGGYTPPVPPEEEPETPIEPEAPIEPEEPEQPQPEEISPRDMGIIGLIAIIGGATFLGAAVNQNKKKRKSPAGAYADRKRKKAKQPEWNKKRE